MVGDRTPPRAALTVCRMSAPTDGDDAVTITINLPLPIDIAATMMRAVGAIWPNCTVDMSSYSDRMKFHVPAADRLADDLDLDEVRAARIAEREEIEPTLTRIGDGQLGGSPAPHYVDYVATLAEAFLDEHNAASYVEQTLNVPGGRRIIVTTQWVDGQTPTEHRNAARAEAARMYRLEAQLRAQIDALQSQLAQATRGH